jgi:hypothetical protein
MIYKSLGQRAAPYEYNNFLLIVVPRTQQINLRLSPRVGFIPYLGVRGVRPGDITTDLGFTLHFTCFYKSCSRGRPPNQMGATAGGGWMKVHPVPGIQSVRLEST